MKTLTAGTTCYEIPLTKGLHLDRGYPLVIMENWDNSFVVECPALDEYGYGRTLDSAMFDLGSSIVDLWIVLRRMTKRHRNLGGSLARVFDEMNGHIKKL